MKRRITLLALAAVSALALAASLGASAASAVNVVVEGGHAKFSGTSTTKHTIFQSGFECEKSTISGEQEAPTATSAVVAPLYSECSVFKSLTMTVKTYNCKFVLFPGKETKIKGEFEGTMEIICPPTIPNIEVVIGVLCAPYLIPPQIGDSVVKYKNLGSGSTREIEIKAAVTNLKYYEGHIPCTPPTFKENGKYEGSWRMAAFEAGPGSKQVGVYLE